MTGFRHHPDGIIYINDNFVCTLAQWLILEPEYQLPVGYIGHEYIRDDEYEGQVINRLFTQKSEHLLNNGEAHWEDGDLYISKVDEYIAELPNLISEPEGDLISA